MFGDFGHQRASNKKAERARLIMLIHAWMDRYLRGTGTAPTGVVASTQTCPRDAPSEGPFRASSFTALARGEVRFRSAAAKAIESSGGDPGVGAAIDPVGGNGDACARTDAADQSGTATYRLPPSTGYILLGAPTILAHLKVTGSAAAAQIAGRLWDVAPGGATQSLVARGEYRPTGAARGEVWQLHANGWRFAPGHVAKLELLGSSPPSSRPSNGLFEVTVERLELRLPVRNRPGCRVVLPAAAPVLPPRQSWAPGVRRTAAPGCGASRPRLKLSLSCTRAGLRATALVPGARRVDFYAAGRRVATDRRPPFSRIVLRGRHRVRIRATAAMTGGRTVSATKRTNGCRRTRSTGDFD